MFQHISTGEGLISSPQPSFPYQNGIVWWDGMNRKVKITDPVSGSSTDHYPSPVNIELDPEVKDAIKWCWKKMQEEKRLDELCKKHKCLDDARQQFEVLKALCNESS